MGFYFFENGVRKYIDHYDPLPGEERENRRDRKYRRPESLPRGWW